MVAPRITFSESSAHLRALLVDLRMMHSGDADVAALRDYQKRLVPSPLATAFGGGCRTKSFRKGCSRFAEMGVSGAGCDGVETDRRRLTDAIADFLAHP